MSPHTMSLSPCTRVVPCKKRPWLPPSPASCSDEDTATHDRDVIGGMPQDLHLSSRASSPPAVTRQLSDFSIERILSDVPISSQSRPCEPTAIPTSPAQDNTFDWLHCTRYRPPKLPRSRRRDAEGGGGVRRRRPGRGPRIPFAPWQVDVLEKRFQHGAYLGAGDVTSLATRLGLADTRVKIWFQNRRARERRDGQSQLGTTKSSPTTSPTKMQPSPPPIIALGSTVGSAFTAIRPIGLNIPPCR